eukprot:17054-Eustigmatos_ZCMA.PRE.1
MTPIPSGLSAGLCEVSVLLSCRFGESRSCVDWKLEAGVAHILNTTRGFKPAIFDSQQALLVQPNTYPQ